MINRISQTRFVLQMFTIGIEAELQGLEVILRENWLVVLLALIKAPIHVHCSKMDLQKENRKKKKSFFFVKSCYCTSF